MLGLQLPLLLALLALLPRGSWASTWLCKCTCFGTNTTILPLMAPAAGSAGAAGPCSMCTRAFCLEHAADACRGATLQTPSQDTGTGWEGEVWSRCFRELVVWCAGVACGAGLGSVSSAVLCARRWVCQPAASGDKRFQRSAILLPRSRWTAPLPAASPAAGHARGRPPARACLPQRCF